ncbi:MAG: tRNA pseudouridine(55) synthase TruB [Thermodesulfobacteriota bacterium]
MAAAHTESRASSPSLAVKDGILLVDKESGPSSFRVAESIKKAAGARKAGHAGTLDPFATGLLIVLLNQGTKLSSYIMSQDKVYRAVIRLGIETDTADETGTIIGKRDIAGLTEKIIEETIQGFVGMIKQVPPRYSAVHYHGKRAYELARKGVQFTPREREVRVNYVTILSIDLPVIWIEVGCSSGTYIRSLVSEFGSRLGAGAHLASLRRIRTGLFHVDFAHTIERIRRHLAKGTIKDIIISLKDAVQDMKQLDIPWELARRIRNGYIPQKGELDRGNISVSPGNYCKAVNGGELVAILRESNHGYELCRVFA